MRSSYAASPASATWTGIDARLTRAAGGTVGPFYTKMIEEVRDAVSKLGDREYDFAGFVWFQGWNDMFNESALAVYEQNLMHLAADVRKEFKQPALPIIIGELGNGGPKAGKNMLAIRAAQKAASARIENALLVRILPQDRNDHDLIRRQTRRQP